MTLIKSITLRNHLPKSEQKFATINGIKVKKLNVRIIFGLLPIHDDL